MSVQVFVNEVNTHREQVLALEKAGSQLRFSSLKQDVVLIKNLLLSVQARWDKLVQRSLDRGRHLDEARKRAKQVLNRNCPETVSTFEYLQAYTAFCVMLTNGDNTRTHGL